MKREARICVGPVRVGEVLVGEDEEDVDVGVVDGSVVRRACRINEVAERDGDDISRVIGRTGCVREIIWATVSPLTGKGRDSRFGTHMSDDSVDKCRRASLQSQGLTRDEEGNVAALVERVEGVVRVWGDGFAVGSHEGALATRRLTGSAAASRDTGHTGA